MALSNVVIGGVESSTAGFLSVVDEVFASVESRSTTVFVSNNLEHVYRSRHELADLGHGDARWLVHLDGMPLVWCARRLVGTTVDRVNGTDLLTSVMQRAARDRVSVGFLGGTDQAHQALWKRVDTLAPGLIVAGSWTPDSAVFARPDRLADLAEEVNAAAPQILVVSLGKPKQELWAAKWAEASGAQAILLTGGAIDLIAGFERRAPALISRSGFEWAWRLAQNPVRLGRRYFRQAPTALWLVLRHSRLVDGR